jgi:hypothetical protein
LLSGLASAHAARKVAEGSALHGHVIADAAANIGAMATIEAISAVSTLPASLFARCKAAAAAGSSGAGLAGYMKASSSPSAGGASTAAKKASAASAAKTEGNRAGVTSKGKPRKSGRTSLSRRASYDLEDESTPEEDEPESSRLPSFTPMVSKRGSGEYVPSHPLPPAAGAPYSSLGMGALGERVVDEGLLEEAGEVGSDEEEDGARLHKSSLWHPEVSGEDSKSLHLRYMYHNFGGEDSGDGHAHHHTPDSSRLLSHHLGLGTLDHSGRLSRSGDMGASEYALLGRDNGQHSPEGLLTGNLKKMRDMDGPSIFNKNYGEGGLSMSASPETSGSALKDLADSLRSSSLRRDGRPQRTIKPKINGDYVYGVVPESSASDSPSDVRMKFQSLAPGISGLGSRKVDSQMYAVGSAGRGGFAPSASHRPQGALLFSSPAPSRSAAASSLTPNIHLAAAEEGYSHAGADRSGDGTRGETPVASASFNGFQERIPGKKSSRASRTNLPTSTGDGVGSRGSSVSGDGPAVTSGMGQHTHTDSRPLIFASPMMAHAPRLPAQPWSLAGPLASPDSSPLDESTGSLGDLGAARRKRTRMIPDISPGQQDVQGVVDGGYTFLSAPRTSSSGLVNLHAAPPGRSVPSATATPLPQRRPHSSGSATSGLISARKGQPLLAELNVPMFPDHVDDARHDMADMSMSLSHLSFDNNVHSLLPYAHSPGVGEGLEVVGKQMRILPGDGRTPHKSIPSDTKLTTSTSFNASISSLDRDALMTLQNVSRSAPLSAGTTPTPGPSSRTPFSHDASFGRGGVLEDMMLDADFEV